MKLLGWLLFGSVIIILAGARPAAFEPVNTAPRPYITNYENVLGTSMELKVYARTSKKAAAAENADIAEISRLSKILSSYDAESEFSRWFNTSNAAVKLSPQLFEALGLFDQWRQRTGGALDPAAEVIGRIWKSAPQQPSASTYHQTSGAYKKDVLLPGVGSLNLRAGRMSMCR